MGGDEAMKMLHFFSSSASKHEAATESFDLADVIGNAAAACSLYISNAGQSAYLFVSLRVCLQAELITRKSWR